jgi:hypothetical protein
MPLGVYCPEEHSAGHPIATERGMITEIPHEIPNILPVEPIASAGTSSTGGTEQSLLLAMQASSTGISPTASFLSHLEMLQKSNPIEFSKAAATISEQLQADAKTAALDGNTTQADRLNHVAAVFETSAHSGQLPALDALHQAGLSRHHYHGIDPATLPTPTATPASTTTPASDSIESIVASAVTNTLDTLNTLNSVINPPNSL